MDSPRNGDAKELNNSINRLFHQQYSVAWDRMLTINRKRRLDDFERQYEATLARNEKMIADTGEGLSDEDLAIAEKE